MNFRALTALVIFLGAPIFGAAEALSQEMRGPQSLDRILPQIRRGHPGTFYDAEGPWPGPNGQSRYRITWMTPDGRIIWFDADARTGHILGSDNPRREFAPRDYPPEGNGDGDNRRFGDDGRGRDHFTNDPWPADNNRGGERGYDHERGDPHEFNRGGGNRTRFSDHRGSFPARGAQGDGARDHGNWQGGRGGDPNGN